MDYAVTFDLWNTLIWERHHDQVANRLSANMGRVLTAAGYGIEKDQLSGIIEECRQMVMARQVKEGLDILPEEQLYWILGRVGLAPTGRVVKELLEYYTSVRDRGEILIMEGAEAVLEVLPGNTVWPSSVILAAHRAGNSSLVGCCWPQQISPVLPFPMNWEYNRTGYFLQP